MQPGDVAAASSSPDLLDPRRLGRLVPLPGHLRPHSNIIQPVIISHEPSVTLPGPGNDREKGIKGRIGGNGGDGKTASPADENAGYSSRPEDHDDATN